MLTLIAIAFIGYEWRVRWFSAQQTFATESRPSPSPAQIEHER